MRGLQQMQEKQILTVQEHPETGELFLEFPLDAINQVGWHEGDILDWLDNGDGSWSVTKREQ
jgi:hypothetical protein